MQVCGLIWGFKKRNKIARRIKIRLAAFLINFIFKRKHTLTLKTLIFEVKNKINGKYRFINAI
jgi:hypothetical protein